MTRRRLWAWLAGLALAWLALTAAQLALGARGGFSFSGAELWQGLRAACGADGGLPGHGQVAFELRLWRALTAGGVGASLGVSGALLQGLFRNGLAEPSLLGISGGANLGATLALMAVAGHAGATLGVPSGISAPAFVTASAFVGALAVALLVIVLARGDGPLDVVRLLLVGVAANVVILGALTALQSLLLHDTEVSRALRAWTFGNLDDRGAAHAAMVWAGTFMTAAVLPFVSAELDLFAGGEDDARSLGVRTGRTKFLVLTAAALATACAFSAAGQIAFLGLLVPHILRMLTGTSHRSLLPLSLVGGAVFLLACDLLQLVALGERRLHTGVLLSLLGGPAFLWLLARSGKARAW